MWGVKKVKYSRCTQVCLELDQTWLESGVSEDAVSGHIQARMIDERVS